MIRTDGSRYLGGAIGTQEFKNKHVNEKIDELLPQLETLNDIAQSEPQCAYAVLAHSLQQSYAYIQRSTEVDPSLYERLEKAIQTVLATIVGYFIPHTCGA